VSKISGAIQCINLNSTWNYIGFNLKSVMKICSGLINIPDENISQVLLKLQL
jgi:hypothetical protein